MLDAESGQVIRVISLQYNPDSLTRGFQLKAGSEGGARAEALRLTGPPVQTLTLEAELDATDRLADPAANPTAVQLGLGAELAALEQLVYPSLASVRDSFSLAGAGMLEIAAAPAPLVLLAFGRQPDPARAHHRAVDHRGGLRPHAQPHPRQGPPRRPGAHRVRRGHRRAPRWVRARRAPAAGGARRRAPTPASSPTSDWSSCEPGRTRAGSRTRRGGERGGVGAARRRRDRCR